jgi:hypothetical protein
MNRLVRIAAQCPSSEIRPNRADLTREIGNTKRQGSIVHGQWQENWSIDKRDNVRWIDYAARTTMDH